MRELGSHLFIGMFVELLSLIVALVVRGDLRRRAYIFLLGTLVAGWIVFSPSIEGFLSQFLAGGTQPTGSTPVIEEVSSVPLVESEKTGTGQRRVYNVSLAGDEIIVGDAYDFEDQGYTCVVFMIQGPGNKQFAVLDGAWYRFSGVTSQRQADELVQARVDYLRKHWFCKDVEFPVIRR